MTAGDWVQLFVAIVALTIATASVLVTTGMAGTAREAAQAARKSAETAAKDFGLRNRPWVGILSIEGGEAPLTAPQMRPTLMMTIRYHNVGSLPARRTQWTFSLSPASDGGDDDTDMTPISFDEDWGGIFPDEPGVRRLPFSPAPRFTDWFIKKLPMSFEGRIAYTHGDRQFTTEFKGSLMPSSRELKVVEWANTEMS